MSNPTNAILQNAFDLIENNELEDAQILLQPLLETEANNPAVWWVYAHALRDPEEGMKAIDKVVQLDPTYPGASELKSQLSEMKEPISEPEPIEPVEEWDESTFVPPEPQVSDSITGGRSPIRTSLIALAVIVIVVGLFAVLSGAFGGDTTQEATEVAEQSTDVPTADSQVATEVEPTDEPTDVEPTDEPTDVEPTDEPTDVEPTDEPTEVEPTDEPTEVEPTDEPTEVEPTDEPTEVEPTDEPAETFLSTLTENLSDYEINEDAIETRDTSLGTTLDVTVCAMAGAPSSTALNDVMGTLVEFNSEIPEDVAAFAVTLIDCNNEQSIPRTIGVERSVVQSFVVEEIALKDLQREWKPLP